MLFEDKDGHYNSSPWGTGKDYGSSKDSAELLHAMDVLSGDDKKPKKETKPSTIGSMIIVFVIGFFLAQADSTGLNVAGWICMGIPIITILIWIYVFIMKIVGGVKHVANSVAEKKEAKLDEFYEQMIDAFWSANYKDAFKLAKKIDDDSPDVNCVIGYCYATGFGGEEDLQKGLEYLKKAAAEDDLAKTYYAEIVCCKVDIEEGARLMKEAADAGYPLASVKYADFLLATEENPDMSEVIRNLEKANSQDSYAQYLLGKIYYEGMNGVDADKDKGLEYLRNAANAGLQDAVEYLNGINN